VDDSDPIKQLQHLLDDRGKVLEKISGIHSALSSLKGPAPTPPSVGSSRVSPSESLSSTLAADERLYDRVLQMLREMQAQIEERVRPLAQLTVDAQVAHLRELFASDEAALQESLAGIDRCIVNCAESFQEYRRRCDDLTSLNEKLAALGAAPDALPGNPAARDVREIIELRLKQLSSTGRL
jgi:hypothetical protein